MMTVAASGARLRGAVNVVARFAALLSIALVAVDRRWWHASRHASSRQLGAKSAALGEKTTGEERKANWAAKFKDKAEGLVNGTISAALDTCFEMEDPPLTKYPHNREGKRRCLPHFMSFGVGHAGSTTLAQMLQIHPDILWNVAWAEGSGAHEVRFWKKKSIQWYRTRDHWSHYWAITQPGNTKRMGGKTPGAWRGGAPIAREILKYAPWLKILMFTREPMEWVMSEEYFTRKDMTSKAKKYAAKLKAGASPACILGDEVQLFKEFVEVFPHDQVFLAASEELRVDRSGVLHRIEDFLGIRHLDYERLIPGEANFHQVGSTPAMQLQQRCLFDICIKAHATMFNSLVKNYTGQSAMYLLDELQYWKQRGALDHTPDLNTSVCKQAIKKFAIPDAFAGHLAGSYAGGK